MLIYSAEDKIAIHMGFSQNGIANRENPIFFRSVLDYSLFKKNCGIQIASNCLHELV